MTVLIIVILAIAAIAVLATAFYFKKSAAQGGSSRLVAPAPFVVYPRVRSPPLAAALVPPAAPASKRAMPAELAGFGFVGKDDLPTERQQALLAELRQIPRPPLSLYKLVSQEYLNAATSIEIGDLIMGEALIAAKVLAQVNSPFYGLRTPVTSIGQAVTFLGLNAVRSVCVQYMLHESFNASNPERKEIFDTLLGASALAGELFHRLAQRLELPEQGSLATQLVLSFLGHLAAVSLMPSDRSLWVAQNGLLERASAEQAQLGLSAAELGALLMQEWSLPANLIDEVKDIDRVLVTPAEAIETKRSRALALCYLCARLGERLSLGSLEDLAAFDPDADSSVEFFHLRSHLDSPRLARLAEFLQAPDMVRSVKKMQAAIH
jgi:HD-like signal output (HDOD) protein